MRNIGKDFDNFGPEDFKELEIPENVNKIEAIIYDMISTHYGNYEAMNPSWNIHMLAQEINAKLKDEQYVQEYTVAYTK